MVAMFFSKTRWPINDQLVKGKELAIIIIAEARSFLSEEKMRRQVATSTAARKLAMIRKHLGKSAVQPMKQEKFRNK